MEKKKEGNEAQLKEGKLAEVGICGFWPGFAGPSLQAAGLVSNLRRESEVVVVRPTDGCAMTDDG